MWGHQQLNKGLHIMASIPVLDLADYEENTKEGRLSFCSALYAALSEYGFTKIVHHRIPDHVLEDVFSWVSIQAYMFPASPDILTQHALAGRVPAFLACH